MNKMKALEIDGKRLRRWIESQGMIFSDEPSITADVEPVFRALQNNFPEFWECVTLQFCYVAVEQPEDLRAADGYCRVDITSDLGALYAIGLSYEATEEGFEYAAMVAMHELTHVLCAIAGTCKVHEHDWHFHNVLDGLIKRFNVQTGLQVTNDYYGLESHMDGSKSH